MSLIIFVHVIPTCLSIVLILTTRVEAVVDLMKRQRSLLDYATSGSSSSSASAHHRAESADCSDSDSSGKPSQPKHWVGGELNSVQVHRTQGGDNCHH